MRHRLITEQVQQPAAGADWSFVPSGGDYSRIVTVTAKLVTGVAVANRVVGLHCKNSNALNYYQADAVYPQVASLSVIYSWSKSGGNGANPTIFTGESVGLALWDHWLEPGDQVTSLTLGLAAGDQWSNIVARYIVGDAWLELEELAALTSALGTPSGG